MADLSNLTVAVSFPEKLLSGGALTGRLPLPTCTPVVWFRIATFKFVARSRRLLPLVKDTGTVTWTAVELNGATDESPVINPESGAFQLYDIGRVSVKTSCPPDWKVITALYERFWSVKSRDCI